MTYANVVATLALFLSLGGTSYAVSQIGSSDVKNRSLKGGDLRRDTVTGKEINESKLAAVPSAGRAFVAASASDAQALAGLGADAFERSTRTGFGRAPIAPADTASEQMLLSWDAMGAELRTSSVGCPADKIRLRLRKTSGPYVTLYEEGTSKGTLVGGQDVSFCSTADNMWDGALADQAGRTLFFECLGVDNAELRCVGTRSEP